MQRGYFKGKVLQPRDSTLINIQTPIPQRRVRKPKRLTLQEKVDVVHRVLVSHEKHADVAKMYRVRSSVVGQLLSKAKKKPAFLGELVHKEEVVTGRTAAISKVVADLIE